LAIGEVVTAVPRNQGLFAEFATVQPLAANVAPFSKPPSPVGEIKVVCAMEGAPPIANAAPSRAAFHHGAVVRVRVVAVF
jgi:hypothetical protein